MSAGYRRVDRPDFADSTTAPLAWPRIRSIRLTCAVSPSSHEAIGRVRQLRESRRLEESNGPKSSSLPDGRAIVAPITADFGHPSGAGEEVAGESPLAGAGIYRPSTRAGTTFLGKPDRSPLFTERPSDDPPVVGYIRGEVDGGTRDDSGGPVHAADRVRRRHLRAGGRDIPVPDGRAAARKAPPIASRRSGS